MTSDIHRMRCRVATVLVTLLSVALLAQTPFMRAGLVAGYEQISFLIAPTAERAYTYGSKHFDASHGDQYDIDRAEYFFKKAEESDPTYPYLQHQLARIAFLRGDFVAAISHINKEIERYGDTHANSYYVRGLIKGFAGDYTGAVLDYETYLKTDPTNWAAINDYAWVLLKADRPRDALISLDWGLIYWPENAWLHNSRATALFELGRLEEAQIAGVAAMQSALRVTEEDWLQAYPGNDPLIAKTGVDAFRSAILENMHTISLALEKATFDVR